MRETRSWKVRDTDLVDPRDPHLFIRLLRDESDLRIADRMRRQETTLAQLGIDVSTGRVVDFRAKEYLRDEPGQSTAPLIYPGHLREGYVRWPNARLRKPKALIIVPATEELLLPPECYVLVKRFSAKEERRRIVAALYEPGLVSRERVGFENHLNYYHENHRGLPLLLARGLTAYLNSTLVDAFFRQFNGHTQVNATDLRSLRYPSRERLEDLGRGTGPTFPGQQELDQLVEEVLL